jgi:hypothetical protein
MAPKLNLLQQVVYEDLLELVRTHKNLVPDARVVVKEDAKGGIVFAIIVPTSTSRVRH